MLIEDAVGDFNLMQTSVKKYHPQKLKSNEITKFGFELGKFINILNN
jgi:hypothetical protein